MKGPSLLILMGISVLLWWEPGLVGLRVEEVEIHGCVHLSPAVAESLAEAHVGFTMGISTCRSLERAFANLPIVEAAQVTRVWPDTLRLHIEEKRLIARNSNLSVSFDVDGNQYRHLEAVSESLPELSGWSSSNQSGWGQAFDVLGIVQTVQPTLFSGARVVGPPVNGSLTLHTQGNAFSVLLPCPPDRGLEDRLEYLPVVLADARSNGESPSSADLRWANQVVLGFDERSQNR
jgi:hypothetical protein